MASPAVVRRPCRLRSSSSRTSPAEHPTTVLNSFTTPRWSRKRPSARFLCGVVAIAALISGCALGAHDVSASPQRDNYAYIAEAVGPSLPVYQQPGGDVLSRLNNPNEWHDPLVLLATARSGDWIKVRMPVRPNGSTGWVAASSVRLTWDPYRIVVDISSHRLTLLNVGQPVMHAPVAVGAKDTPTPRGTFYLTALLQPPNPAGAYGPYAFGLSGYSPVLKTFAALDAKGAREQAKRAEQAVAVDMQLAAVRLDAGAEGLFVERPEVVDNGSHSVCDGGRPENSSRGAPCSASRNVAAIEGAPLRRAPQRHPAVRRRSDTIMSRALQARPSVRQPLLG